MFVTVTPAAVPRTRTLHRRLYRADIFILVLMTRQDRTAVPHQTIRDQPLRVSAPGNPIVGSSASAEGDPIATR